MSQTDTEGGIAALLEEVKRHHEPDVRTFAEPEEGESRVLIVPEGMAVHEIEKFIAPYRARPLRRRGTAKIRDIASFCAHANAFKDANSAVFAVPDRSQPRLIAVYNYNERGGVDDVDPRHGDHRAELALELSKQWQAWSAFDGKAMDQGTFAAFLEDNIQDVMLVDGPHIKELAELLEARVGGPSSLMKLSRGLQVSVNTTVRNAVTLATGEVQVLFVEEQSADGGGPITTPNLFFLNIPVFTGGDAYQVGMRLRYRLAQGKLQWSYHLYRADQVFDDAFKGIVDKARTECDLAVYTGEPEV